MRSLPSNRPAALLTVVLLLVALTACGGDRDEAAAGPSGAGFPVTVEHLFGSTTIEARPQRVVTLGGGDMEAAISLGVDPVAGADWFGFTEQRTWVKEALGDRPAPQLIRSSEPDFEQIAALRPDLILYVNAQNRREDYEKFSQIAPTVAAPPGTTNVYGVKWQDQVRTIAKATGTAAEGDQVVAGTEKLLADTAAAHPEFAGKTISAGVFTSDAFSVWMPSDPRMRLLSSLGWKNNDRIAALDQGNFFVEIGAEQLEKLNADVLLLAAQDQQGRVDPKVSGNRVFANLATVRAGHVAYFGGAPVINSNTGSGQFSSAVSIGGPLGIRYALPRLVELLTQALRGR